MQDERARADELLRPFRALEDKLDGIAVLGDLEAGRVLRAWTTTAPIWAPPAGEPPTDLAARWRWLWMDVAVCPGDLARSARVSPLVANKAFESLRDMRAIYPDGTANSEVVAVLRSQMAAHLKGNHTRPR